MNELDLHAVDLEVVEGGQHVGGLTDSREMNHGILAPNAEGVHWLVAALDFLRFNKNNFFDRTSVDEDFLMREE
jgi:hypothetical protein